MNDSHIPTQKKRSGWIGFAYACGLFLLTALAFGIWWWNSDADLEDVRKQATENHIPITWAEFGIKISEPERLARWKRIVALSNKLPTYQGLKKSDNPKFVLFSPIPSEMRNHHDSLDETTWTELLHELNLLGDQPLFFRDTTTFNTLLPEIGEYRAVLRLLEERIALADTPEALRLCSIQLALCRTFENNSLLTQLVKTSLISMALASANHHLFAFKVLNLNLADDIRSTTEHYPQQFNRALTGEFLAALQHCARPEDNLQNDWFMPLVVRAGRKELLTTEIENITYIRAHDLLTNLAWQRAQMTALRARKSHIPNIPSPGLILCGMTLPQYEFILSSAYETQLKGRLLAAELQNQPWPQDIFDPTGANLRPFMRDGKVIGAYSVGLDGKDDGCDKKKDKYFPLYGPLELPVAPTSP